MVRSFIIAIGICYLGLAFTTTKHPFYWLEGIWEMKKPNGSSRLEIWNSGDDGSITGKGLKVVKADTTVLEMIELAFRDDQYWYIPTVPDQNKAMPVPFKLVNTDGHKYTFENPDHDFPQRIMYQLKPLINTMEYMPSSGDTLFVRVESLEGKGIDYQFYRK